MKHGYDNNQSLILRGSFPLTISSLSSIPEDYALNTINDSNLHVLQTDIILNEVHESDDNELESHELKKLDIKMTLLMEMIGDLLSKENIIPSTREIILTSEYLACDIDLTLSPETLLEIKLYLLPSIPKPITLIAKYIRSSDVDNNTNLCRFEILSMPQQVKDLLEKIIFRHHRRAIANQKI